MIGYVTLGTNDLKKAGRFYDKLLHELGARRYMEGKNFIAWSKTEGGVLLGIHVPFDGKRATVGNGVMVALAAVNASQVERIYHIAISSGAADEGPPGYRDETFYAAYFRDLDGNKLNAYVLG
jgi:predicted lactoylglutathione lyase